VRLLTLILIAVWVVLTIVGVTVVLPEKNADRAMIHAFWEMSDLPQVARMEGEYGAWYADRFGESAPAFVSLIGREEKDPTVLEQEDRFRQWYNANHDPMLDGIPRLVWSTDDNPARRIQMQLFRRWHLKTYGEPIDIVTDPANRDATKMVIQSVVGTGADIIESYGPEQFQAFVDAGIVLDISEEAERREFGYERCFDAAWSSFVRDGRQYGFPANVGYVVLFYHIDLMEQAGIDRPIGGWSIDELIEIASKLTVESPDIPGGKRWGIVGMHPWPMALSNGARFFSDDGTHSTYNSPETIAAFTAFHDLLYRAKVMPTPADSASMAAAAGFTGGSGAGASNGLYFAAKLAAMTVGGRWEYVTYAQANRDRVIVPALRRELDRISGSVSQQAAGSFDNTELFDSESLRSHRLKTGATASETTSGQLQHIIDSLNHDVLDPLSDQDDQLINDLLTTDDHSKLLQIGVAHVPTVSGEIRYTDVGARVALINRETLWPEHALRFLEFLASEPYNEQINQTDDSICGVIEFCTDEDGISGPPRPLPGLEQFDSPVFIQAMDGAESQQISPYIGPSRQGFLAGQVMDQLMSNRVNPAEAARLIENRLNAQIMANVQRDALLRAKWEEAMGQSADSDEASSGGDSP